MQPLFESWSPSRLLVPPRTLLYALDPIGIGTCLIESLSSYLVRLAEAHSVRVGDIVGRLLAEIPNPKGTILMPSGAAFRPGGHGFQGCTYAMNGANERTERWIYALEVATGRRDLLCMTLLPLRSALAKDLFRRHRAWCPACLEYWRATGHAIYEPLAWAFETSSCCPVHKILLQCCCHQCGWRLRPVGVFSRSGYCQHCGVWLGRAIDTDKESPRVGSISQEALWASEQVGQLLTILPRAVAETSGKYLRKNLEVYVREVAGGNVRALAERIPCSLNVVLCWLNGSATPSLQNLLRTARMLNVSVASFFAPTEPMASDISATKQAVAVAGHRKVGPARTAGEIQKALRAALQEDVPISLSSVAQKLGYKRTNRLYAADQKLCHKITAQHRKSGRAYWWRQKGATIICDSARLKAILEESLRSPQPTSVCSIAAQLGYANPGHIYGKFPELCAAISRRVAQAKQAGFQTLRLLLEKALCECPAPTLADLSRRLGWKSSTVLRKHEPDLCDQLLARHRNWMEEHIADLRKLAEAALEETPGPSVQSVCIRMGISTEFMDRHFPDVRRRLAEQHSRCSTAETALRHERLSHAIRDVALELHGRGLYPSKREIMKHVPEEFGQEWQTIAAAVREVQTILGLRT